MTTNNTPRHDYADKIAKMLAAAESYAQQGLEDAAAAYNAKASQLQLEMMIADSDIRAAARGAVPVDELGHQAVQGLPKGAGYIKAKRDLIFGLANIFHLRTTIAHDRSSVQIYGHETDRKFVQQLFDSLVLQLHSHMEYDAKKWGTADRRWRTSYAHGWVNRVIARLKASRAAQETQAAETPGTELVLRDRSAAVKTYFDDLFAGQRLRSSYKNRSVGSAAGYLAGGEAANRAALGGKAVGSTRRELGS